MTQELFVSLYSSQKQIHTLNVKMGTLRVSVVAKYKDFDDYTQNMLDVWTHGFEITKW